MFGINKNGTKHKVGIIMPANYPASRITRESVSVTADGVKTYSQLLDSLFALIDFSKITENSVVKISSSTVMQVYTMSVMHPNTDMHLFRLARSGSQCVETVTVLLPSGSTMGYWTGGTYTNESGNAPASGRVIAFCY